LNKSNFVSKTEMREYFIIDLLHILVFASSKWIVPSFSGVS